MTRMGIFVAAALSTLLLTGPTVSAVAAAEDDSPPTITEVAASRTQVTANDNQVQVSATLSKTLPGPYRLAIYDDLGALIDACENTKIYRYTTCSGPVPLVLGLPVQRFL